MKSAVFGLPSIQPVVAAWKGVGGGGEWIGFLGERGWGWKTDLLQRLVGRASVDDREEYNPFDRLCQLEL